jgi:hypothetical protein
MLRILAFLLGIGFLVIAIFMLILGRLDLWVAFFIGPLFIVYSLKGNKGLLKTRLLSSYGKKIGK